METGHREALCTAMTLENYKASAASRHRPRQGGSGQRGLTPAHGGTPTAPGDTADYSSPSPGCCERPPHIRQKCSKSFIIKSSRYRAQIGKIKIPTHAVYLKSFTQCALSNPLGKENNASGRENAGCFGIFTSYFWAQARCK